MSKKKPADKNPHESSVMRFILSALMSICIVLGGGMLFRAYFLAHPPSSGGTVQGNSLSTNLPTVVPEITTGSTNTVTGVWGESLSDVYSLPETDGVWVKITSQENVIIGELLGTTVRDLYSLPHNTGQIRLFTDKSIAYTTTSTNTSDAQLIAYANKPTTVQTLDAGWEYTSLFFEPKQKFFYIAKVNKTGASRVERVRAGSDALFLYESSSFPDMGILSVDPDRNMLFFQVTGPSKTSDCYSLALDSKSVNSVTCSSVRQTANGINFTFFTPLNGIYSLSDKGFILRTDVNSGTEHYIRNGVEGEIFSPFIVRGNALGIVYSHVLIVDVGGFLPVALNIQILDLANNNVVLTQIDTLPDGKILELGLAKLNQPVAVVDGTAGNQLLEVYAVKVISDSQGTLIPGINPVWQPVDVPGCSSGCQYHFL